jgi:hypothetical protein
MRYGKTSGLAFGVLLAACGGAQDDVADAMVSDSAFEAVQERGREVMGVDQYAARHVFDVMADGGRIELQWDSDDAVEVAKIRRHMVDIVRAFSAGDFSSPFAVHAMEVPGTRVLREKKDAIVYSFHPLPRGGEVRMQTMDPAAIAAIRAFMEFQRSDHRAGGHTHGG